MAEQCQAWGTKAAVAAAAPLAAQIAAGVLRDGGNAYDAAVAAALAETVLLPPKCGLAGDLVALCWRRGDERPEVLLAVGGAPAGLAEIARQGRLEPTGPLSVGVPGAPHGYLELAARGRLPLARLASPAIELAEEGFCWSRICSALAAESADLVARHNPDGTRYYPHGEVIAPGTVMRFPKLGLALRALLADGFDFLRGEVGAAIVRRVAGAGGVLGMADLEGRHSEWTGAQAGRLGSLPLFATPAPTHGPALLMATGDLAVTDTPAAAVHRNVMAVLARGPAGFADQSGTSMVSAIDRDGTMVTVVHSNSWPRFGSGLIVPEFDLILANRAGRGFGSNPADENFPLRGRRPDVTLHAWAIAGPHGMRIQGATPGGANQMPWNAQTLARFARGETDIGRLIVAPRWEWLPATNGLRIEDGFGKRERSVLEAAAAHVEKTGRWGTASAMQIVADDPAARRAGAAADPRTVGAALAF